MKKISILGSTGSIGTNSLKVIHANPDEYKVVGLAAGRNIALLKKQIETFHPKTVATLDESLAKKLKASLGSSNKTEILWGTEGFIQVASMESADTIISAMSGAAGLVPTYAAIKSGKNIALANKETMVTAGRLIMEEAGNQEIDILPVDSEHSAIFQSLQGHPRKDIRRIILTASGGPFFGWSAEKLATVTPDQALQHPNWSMGRKISIDSATLMNKGLEAIEAKWLFGLRIDQIDIIIHPQSIIHSMVEYKDGSIIAQMGTPDMKIPISYALSFPEHLNTNLPFLNFSEIGTFNFFNPDYDTFKCLKLALSAVEAGDSMPAVLNGANEIAVDAFLKNEIGFMQIPDLIEKTMETHDKFPVDTIEKVMKADLWSRKTARGLISELKG